MLHQITKQLTVGCCHNRSHTGASLHKNESRNNLGHGCKVSVSPQSHRCGEKRAVVPHPIKKLLKLKSKILLWIFIFQVSNLLETAQDIFFRASKCRPFLRGWTSVLHLPCKIALNPHLLNPLPPPPPKKQTTPTINNKTFNN